MEIKELDLRSYCRDADRVESLISLEHPIRRVWLPWIMSGPVRFTKDGDSVGNVEAMIEDAEDEEGDTARAFRIPIIGATTEFHVQVVVMGWIAPVPVDTFDAGLYVPEDASDPRGETLAANTPIRRASYLPIARPDLHAQLAGRRVRILTGIIRRDRPLPIAIDPAALSNLAPGSIIRGADGNPLLLEADPRRWRKGSFLMSDEEVMTFAPLLLLFTPGCVR